MATIFISYSEKDTEDAHELSAFLDSELGLRHEVFLARDKIPAGENWERMLLEQLRDMDALVCLVTPNFVESHWCTAEVSVARTRGKRILPLKAGADPTEIPMLRLVNFIDYTAKSQDQRNELLSQLRKFVDTVGTKRRPGQSPFPGLDPFNQDLAWAFFGRREETIDLAERLRSPATVAAGELVVVVGPPGCGKSSLVRAGVLPLWSGEPGRWALPPVVPTEHPTEALADAFVKEAVRAGLDWTRAEVKERLDQAALTSNAGEPQQLVDEILAAAQKASPHRPLIVLDQFEGVVTQAERPEREKFAKLLRALLACRVRIVATLRSEFLPAIQESTRLFEVPLHLFTLRPVGSRQALEEIISKPAEQVGINVPSPLVEALIRDFQNVRDAPQEGDALPLLAYTLSHLQRVSTGGALSMEDYENLGGIDGALRRLADEAVETRQQAGRPTDEVLASLLQVVAFDQNGEAIGKHIDNGSLPDDLKSDLAAFVDHRLLTTRIERESKVFAVGYRRFLREWPPLANKIKEEKDVLQGRESLAIAARDWKDAGRPRDRLWIGKRIAAATMPGPSGTSRILSDLEREFMEACGKQARRKRGFMSAGLSVVFVIVLGLAGSAGYQWKVAHGERSNAVERELLALTDDRLESDPRLAIQIAIAANDIVADDDTRAGLHDALVGTGYLGSLEHEGAQRAVAFSPDGRTVAFGGDDGVVVAKITETGQTGEVLQLPKEHAAPVNAVAFFPKPDPDSGDILAAADAQGKVILWNLTDPARPRHDILGDHKAAINALAISPDGRFLATAGQDGRISFWSVDLTNPDRLDIYGIPGEQANAVAFSHDGRMLAAGFGRHGSGDGTGGAYSGGTNPGGGGTDPGGKVVLWEIPAVWPRASGSSGAVEVPNQWELTAGSRTLEGHKRAVTSVAFRPDGRSLATGDASGTVMVWDTSAADPPGVPSKVKVLPPPHTEYTGPITGLVYTSDGKLVTASQKQAVLVRDSTNPDVVLGPPISDRGSPPLGVAVSPDGKTLAVANQSGGVLLWSLAPKGQPEALGAPITGVPAFDMDYVEDGSALFAARRDESLHIWHVAESTKPAGTGKPYALGEAFGEVLETTITGSGCVFGADGKSKAPAGGCRLAISGDKGRVEIFDMTDLLHPKLLADFTPHPNTAVNDMQFGLEGNILVTGAKDGTISIWDTANRNPNRTPRRIGQPLKEHTKAVRDVEFDGSDATDPNARDDVLASSGDDGTVRLWDVADPAHPRLLATLTDPSGPVNDIQFSRDAKTLFAASDDGNVWGWDVSRADRPVLPGRQLDDHRGPVYDMALVGGDEAGEAEILATAGHDRRVSFWDISDAHRPRPLGPVITHADAVVELNVAEEVDQMATASEDGTIRFWDVTPLLKGTPSNLVELACARANGGLSKDRWNTYIPDPSYRPTCQ